MRLDANADPLELARVFYPDAVEAEWDDETHGVLNVRLPLVYHHVVVDLVSVPLSPEGQS